MFKRDGERSRFDSVSLVELSAMMLPDGNIQSLKARLCYVDSVTGMTFGFIDMAHEPGKGLEVLGPDAMEAWIRFCEEVEKQQGLLLFGKGDVFGLGEGQGPDKEGDIQIGLGGVGI